MARILPFLVALFFYFHLKNLRSIRESSFESQVFMMDFNKLRSSLRLQSVAGQA